jgi:phosphoribosylglycinamide formyltransferase-1
VVAAQNAKVPVAIFGSGAGSTARAILEYERSGERAFSVELVLTNRADAGIIGVAEQFGIRSTVLSPRGFSTEDAYATAMIELLRGIELVVLAGYLLKVPRAVVAHFRDRILNVHPALLPKFGGRGMYGIHVHRAVLAAGERCSGATIHLVTEEYDAGPILEQVRVPVNTDDTPETLMLRVQAAERYLYPRTVERYCQRSLEWGA